MSSSDNSKMLITIPVLRNIKEVTLAQANALTQARYDFTLVEKRALYFVISEVRRRFIDRTDGQRTLFNDLVVYISTSNLTGANMKLSEVYSSLRLLCEKKIWLMQDGAEIDFTFIAFFDHKQRGTLLEVVVSAKVLPFLVALASHFTTYSLTVAVTLNAKYSQRFYEFCSQYENNDSDPENSNSGYFFFTVTDLRRKLMIEDKYPKYGLMKKYVLDTAQRELKTMFDAGQCNLYFEYREEKAGKRINRLHFFVYSRNTKKHVVGSHNLMDQTYYIRLWLEGWLSAKTRPKNKEWVNMVISHINLRPTLITKLYLRLAKMKTEDLQANYAALARHIIEKDILTVK